MLCNAPSYLFTVPGTLLAVVGLGVMAVAATGVSVGGASLGIHSMIAGSLATIVGVQTVALAVFAAFAADPIRSPRGPLIRLIERHFTLGYGVFVGLALSVAGGGYAALLAWQWAASGFAAQPLLTADVAAFTAVLLGLQVVFDAFFLWIVRE